MPDDVAGNRAASDRRRYRLDSSFRQHGTVVIGGSPLKLFRLTEGGASIVARIAAGEQVAGSLLTVALLDAGAIHPEPDHARHSAADVTLVVPTLGMPAHVPNGAILVDDGSQPPIPDATIRLETNQGPGAARNAGLERITTELVAFVDADVELTDGWLDPLLAHFADERVAIVAPRVRTRPEPTMLGRYEHAHSPLDLGPEPARVRAGTRVSYVPAAAILCRTEAIRSVGGFDAALRFGEDVDLVWRLGAAGWVCRYEPAAEVHHAIRPDLAAWIRQRIDYGSSAAALGRRHQGALAPIRMSGWSVGSWALAAIGRPLLGSIIGIGSAAALSRKLPDLPTAASIRLAGLGNLHAGNQIASAVRRVWWPLLAFAAVRSRSARRILLASAIAARHPLAVADDLAYSFGVWKGMWTERTLDPLVPEISSWPGRATASPTTAAR
jgi:mycofactocin system glycosyltransferase